MPNQRTCSRHSGRAGGRWNSRDEYEGRIWEGRPNKPICEVTQWCGMGWKETRPGVRGRLDMGENRLVPALEGHLIQPHTPEQWVVRPWALEGEVAGGEFQLGRDWAAHLILNIAPFWLGSFPGEPLLPFLSVLPLSSVWAGHCPGTHLCP